MNSPFVLCIDDEKIILDSLKLQLKKAFGTEFRIELAESGSEALEILDELDSNGDFPCVIISDQIMPEMKGDELLQRIKEKFPKTACILLTGQANLQDVISAINNAGIYRFVQKPWNEMDLCMTVREAIRLYHKDRELESRNKELAELNQSLEIQVAKRSSELRAKKEKIQALHLELLSSISYAKRIQSALFTDRKQVSSILNESFVFFKPLNEVSGDFYWIENRDEEMGVTFVVVSDCTGHGVPGAFLSVIGILYLNYIILILRLTNPAEILTKLHTDLVDVLKQKNSTVEDGMDISICMIDRKNRQFQFAGANQRLIKVSKNKTTIIPGEKLPVGGLTRIKRNYKTIDLEYDQSANYYLQTDGFTDQFGGKRNKKMLLKGYLKILSSINALTMAEQADKLLQSMNAWQGKADQIDDMTVVGFKLP